MNIYSGKFCHIVVKKMFVQYLINFHISVTALDVIYSVEVQAIIGPETSMQANFIISLGNKAQVPIISFSATSPSLTSSALRKTTRRRSKP